MTRLEVIDAGLLDPDDERALLGSLLAGMGRDVNPVLCACVFSGNGVSLGRYQEASRALDIPACRREGFAVHRRLTGGAAVVVGDGILSLALILPDASAFSDRIFPEKVINRYVRGILSGIQLLGADAAYTGSDFISINRRRGAYCAMDVDARGAVLFQTFLAVDRSYILPDGLNAYPRRRETRITQPIVLREACRKAATREEILSAVAGGYRKRFGIESAVRPLKQADFQWKPAIDNVEEYDLKTGGLDDWKASSLREFPLGFFGARVRMHSEGSIAVARFHGDFIANHPAIERLEKELSGKPPRGKDLEEALGPVFSDRNNFFLGLRSPSTLIDAVLDASGSSERPKPVRVVHDDV